MATWIAHMRIAEHFMLKKPGLNNERFLVGNIGPDCGVPNADWSSFTPNKSVTHWHAKDGSFVDVEDFRNTYLSENDERFPFYLGYYFHLLTDIEWGKLYERKKLEPIYAEGLAKDKNFIWEIKKDWYGQDHLFLRWNPDFIFFSIFSRITEFENQYFDFYPDNAFIRQIKYITNYYLTAAENPGRDFPFLNRAEMDDFIKRTAKLIEETYPL